MSKKYKIIIKEQILELFRERDVVSTSYICYTYNCSRYLVIQLIDDLIQDKEIKLTSRGYKKL